MSNLENFPISDKKQPSTELLDLIQEFKGSIVKSRDLFIKIVDKARNEGFEDQEIDAMLYSKLKEIIPKSTLLRYRKEFIPLGVKSRNFYEVTENNLDLKNNVTEQSGQTVDPKVTEQSSVRSGPNEPMNNDIFQISENEQNTINVSKEDYQQFKKWQAEKQYQKEIMEKFDPGVVKEIKRCELSIDKLELLLNPNLREYPDTVIELANEFKERDLSESRILLKNVYRGIRHGLIAPQSKNTYSSTAKDLYNGEWDDYEYRYRQLYALNWFESLTAEEKQGWKEDSQKTRDFLFWLKMSDVYRYQYFETLEQFVSKYEEMSGKDQKNITAEEKKTIKWLYIRLIELNWLDDKYNASFDNARYNIKEDCKSEYGLNINKRFINEDDMDLLIEFARYNKCDHNDCFEY